MCHQYVLILCLFSFFSSSYPHFLVLNASEPRINGAYLCSTGLKTRGSTGIICHHANKLFKLYSILVTKSNAELEKRLYIEGIDEKWHNGVNGNGDVKGKIYGSVWGTNTWKHLIKGEYDHSMSMIPLQTLSDVVKMSGLESLHQLSLPMLSHLTLMELHSRWDSLSEGNDDDKDSLYTLMEIISQKRGEERMKNKSVLSLSFQLSLAAECEYYVHIDNWERIGTCYQVMKDEIWSQKHSSKKKKNKKLTAYLPPVSSSASVLTCSYKFNHLTHHIVDADFRSEWGISEETSPNSDDHDLISCIHSVSKFSYALAILRNTFEISRVVSVLDFLPPPSHSIVDSDYNKKYKLNENDGDGYEPWRTWNYLFSLFLPTGSSSIPFVYSSKSCWELVNTLRNVHRRQSKRMHAVEEIFTSLCFSLDTEVKNRRTEWEEFSLSIDTIRSLVLSLLSTGNPEVSSTLVLNKINQYKNKNDDIVNEIHENSIEEEVHPNLRLLHSMILRENLGAADRTKGVSMHQSGDFYDTVGRIFHNSSSVRALSGYLPLIPISSDLMRNSDLFSLFISTAIQLGNPVILSTSSEDSLLEALILRLLLHQILVNTIEECRSSKELHNCHIDDPISSIGVRGIFLIAYQGLALTQRNLTLNLSPLQDYGLTVKHKSKLRDFSIPKLYKQLLKESQSIFPQQENVMTPETKEKVMSANIKVGFLSTFFFRHSVGKLLGRLIKSLALRNNGLEVYIIDTSEGMSNSQRIDVHDDISQSLKSSDGSIRWRTLSSSISSASSQLMDINLDILVFGDNYMDTLTAHLIMQRYAPVQILFWGHPFTSGYDSIDYFISSDVYETITGRGHRQEHIDEFSEQVVLFDSLTFALSPEPMHAELPTVSSSIDMKYHFLVEYAIQLDTFHDRLSKTFVEGKTFYVCMQSIMKMHPLFDTAIVEILERDETAIVILLSNEASPFWMNKLKSRLIHALSSPSSRSRVLFIPQLSSEEYKFVICNIADVNLDPFPFGGGITMTDSLLCTDQLVPIVSNGYLQSVHQLGRGINYRLSKLYADNFEANYMSGVIAFAQQAIELAHNGSASTEEMNLTHLVRRKLLEIHPIEVIEEWEQFLVKVYRGS